MFVEVPISNYNAILGLPWLETVIPDINYINKTIQPRSNSLNSKILPDSYSLIDNASNEIDI